MIITIAGHKGAGKSTAGELLAKRLGYEYFYMGDKFREQAEEHGMTIAEFDEYVQQHPDIDRAMDKKVYGELQGRSDVVVDANLAALFLQDAFNVFLTAPLKVRAQRVAGRPRRSEESLSVDDAQAELQRREQIVQERLMDLYDFDVFNEEHYDLVVDTAGLSPGQVVDRIAQAL